MKPNPFTKDVDAFEPPAKGGEMSNKPESRKDEIIKILRRQEDYETVATEIEKLYQAGGKVEYVVQRKGEITGNWKDFITNCQNGKDAKTEKNRFLLSYPEAMLRPIKRTTIDQIIS